MHKWVDSRHSREILYGCCLEASYKHNQTREAPSFRKPFNPSLVWWLYSYFLGAPGVPVPSWSRVMPLLHTELCSPPAQQVCGLASWASTQLHGQLYWQHLSDLDLKSKAQSQLKSPIAKPCGNESRGSPVLRQPVLLSHILHQVFGGS